MALSASHVSNVSSEKRIIPVRRRTLPLRNTFGGSRLAPTMLRCQVWSLLTEEDMQVSLAGGSDFPRTYREFVEEFSSDNACAAI